MAERLTRKIGYEYEKAKRETQLLEINNKLGKLEDILEKYGIESVEELDYLLEVFKKMRKEYGKLNQENYKNKKDRDTWKRACELACEREDDCYVYDNIHRAYEFYQQAKKEGENETNISGQN